MKVHVFGIITLAVVIAPFSVDALVITEIMYDAPGSDTGKEWVEVFNNGTSSIELARMRLHDKNNHIITLAHGSASISPGAYAIIARDVLAFEAVYPSASLTLFRSALSFNNTGGVISIRDGDTHVLDTAVYSKSMGAGGNGNTLNRDASSVAFFARSPSPGTAMAQFAIAPQTTPVATQKQTPTKKLKPSQKSLTSLNKNKQNTYTHAPTEDDTDSIATETLSNVQSVSDIEQTATAVSSVPNSKWLLAFFALVVLSITAVLSTRHFAKREWDIVDE